MTEPNRRDFLVQSAGALVAIPIIPDLAGSSIRRSFTGAPIQVAVIGAGRQGRAILGELQKMENVKIAAVCDIDESRMNSGVRRVPGAEGLRDHRAVLDKKDIQAVVIATPTHQHTQIA